MKTLLLSCEHRATSAARTCLYEVEGSVSVPGAPVQTFYLIALCPECFKNSLGDDQLILSLATQHRFINREDLHEEKAS